MVLETSPVVGEQSLMIISRPRLEKLAGTDGLPQPPVHAAVISGSLLACTGGPSLPGVDRRRRQHIGSAEFFESGSRNNHQGLLPDVGGGL